MKITVLTVMPELFEGFFKSPVIQRAIRSAAVSVTVADIRDFVKGSFRAVDDSPYGGGAGMILRCEPVIAALEHFKTPRSHTILFSPAGKTYKEKDARRLSEEEDLILICGHYEGVDARIEKYCDELISLGDYILTGGEICAMAVMDSVIRLFPESLKEEATSKESFEHGLLEYPQYTRPREFRGDAVPEVLLSGNHEAIEKWRREAALERTRRFRPDLLASQDEASKAEI